MDQYAGKPDSRMNNVPVGSAQHAITVSHRGAEASRQAGMTLVEVLVAVVLLSLLLTVAIPSFRTMLLNNRMLTQANSLVSALNLARSHAVKRSDNVTVCRRDGSDWLQGWRILTGADCNLDSGEIELVVHGTLEGLQQLSATGSSLTFSGKGTPSSSLLFTLCDERGADHARAVQVNNAGRVKTLTTKADGSPLTCS
jgi:type IV fimbrial biogenesis protein FimT